MASGSKTTSAFTDNSIGGTPGKTQFQKTSSGGNVGGGGKIITPFPQDNIHGVDLPDTMGGKFGGGVDNLSHSLSGSSAVQRNKGKPESSGI